MSTQKPIAYSKEAANQLDSQLERIGAYDHGNGGLMATNCNGFLAVADTESYYVSEHTIEALAKLPDNHINDEEVDDLATLWQDIFKAIGSPDFSEIDAAIDEIYESIGETGYWKQKGEQALMVWKEENADPRVLSQIPGQYARHYLAATYADF